MVPVLSTPTFVAVVLSCWGKPMRDPRLAVLAIQRGERAYAIMASAVNRLRWLYWPIGAVQLATGVVLGGTTAVLYFRYLHMTPPPILDPRTLDTTRTSAAQGRMG
jgi:hypothetical protein